MLKGSFHVVLEPSQHVWPNLCSQGVGSSLTSVRMVRGCFSLERSCGKTGNSNHVSNVSVSLAWLQAGQPLPYQGVVSGDDQSIAAGGQMGTLDRL